MTLDDGIRSFINVLRLQAPKSDSKITKNTQNTRWPFLAPPDHANALLDVCENHGWLTANLTGLMGRERFSIKIVFNDVQDEGYSKLRFPRG
jgi:hypothetical protein